MTESHVLYLPIRKPPLTANQRHTHWSQRHTPEKNLQAATMMAVSQQWKGLRFQGPVDIQMEYYPNDNRHRDSDNIAPSLKPVIDGLRHAGVLINDTSTYVRRTSTMIVRKCDDPTPDRDARGPEVLIVVTAGSKLLGRSPRAV